jgi:hypothetical protein
MAFDVRTFYRGSLANQGFTGGGVNGSGKAQDNKVVVVGDINITTYTAGGEPVTAADLGLDTLDCILLEVVNVDSTVATTTNIHKVNYEYGSNLVICWDGAAFATVPGTSARVRFAAFGEVAVPELV